MNKKVEIFKISNYDKFKCTADKCKFTCCAGWDVSIDKDTYNKWKKENHKTGFVLNNVKIKKCGSKREYFINKENHEACALLDKQGLCQVVKTLGEEYLAFTCHTFPRIENIFEDKKELSLSCACPEVVELISRLTEKINIISENDSNLKSNLLELKIRDAMVNIIRMEKFSLEEKLIVSFQMLLAILEDKNFTEKSLIEELETYKSRNYIQKHIDIYKKIDFGIKDSVEEINYLFLDMTKNYKEVAIFEIFLKDISDFAENIKIENISAMWQDYKSLFEQYNMLNENCIISDILSSCINYDIFDMAVSFQMIIVEYLLVRYAVFLKYCMSENKEIDIQDIKDYIVVFSRIIGNNTQAVIEFFREGFGKDVLDIEYVCFIGLF